jgi:para-nitrobenzyl esterase
LFLNVVTAGSEGTPRPVLFWIHGGAYTQGSANDYDGSILAAQGDVVVVTINYRLGLLGYAGLASLGAEFEGTASNGFRDQILALKWVRDNIADYGGDPKNVTIFGESAGGGSVLALLAAPSADGLYHKAIAHSPGNIHQPSQDMVATLASQLSVEKSALAAKLRALSVAEIVQLQATAGQTGGTVDGTVVTRSANAAITERGKAGVPLIAGSNLNEGTLFTMLLPEQVWSALGPGLAMTVTSGRDPPAYLKALATTYPNDTPKQNNERIWTDMFRHSAIATAQRATHAGPGGWLYQFNLPSTKPMNGLQPGATHAAEIAFTFNTFAGGKGPLNLYDATDPVVTDLAHRWSDTIITFARTGNPNGAGLPHWPRYSKDTRNTLLLDREAKIVADLNPKQRQLWESVSAAP